MRSPPDARVPGPGSPGNSNTPSTTIESDPRIEHRCHSGVACEEVVARLEAADRSQLEGHAEVAAQLRDTAERFAMVHGYGQDQSGPPA